MLTSLKEGRGREEQGEVEGEGGEEGEQGREGEEGDCTVYICAISLRLVCWGRKAFTPLFSWDSQKKWLFTRPGRESQFLHCNYAR
jgi:hypothetical protein